MERESLSYSSVCAQRNTIECTDVLSELLGLKVEYGGPVLENQGQLLD